MVAPALKSPDSAVSSLAAEIESPGYQERVMFLGANGSGKSVLASKMMSEYPRVVVLDVKGDFEIPWRKGTYHVTDKPNGIIWQPLPHNRIIYRPRREYREPEWMAWFLGEQFERAKREGKKRPFIVYIDECLYVANQGCKAALADLAVTGRSMGLGFWYTSQRPRNIPVELRSEAWRTYLFYLDNKGDRKEVVDNSGGSISEHDMLQSAADYSFWEIRRGKGGSKRVRHLPPVNPRISLG